MKISGRPMKHRQVRILSSGMKGSLYSAFCYLDEDGEFTDETYTTLVHFTARLLQKYGLEAEDLRRHYDEGGKACPKYYVENEDEWWNFVRDVKVYKMTLEEE